MIYRLDYGGAQDRGRRPYQEDSFHLERLPGTDEGTGGLLMVMADGMGGHRGGAEASAAAIEAFSHTYLAEAATEAEPETERLRRGLLAANQRIADEAEANPALRGMGCTLVGVSLTPAGLNLISVGDSVAYLFRNGELTRLNADHSMAPVLREAVRLGKLSEEELACHPNRNALRSVVMGRDLNLIDLRPEPLALLPGDRLVVASDGILTLPEEQISALVAEHLDSTADQLSELLVQAVNEADAPHQDNVTVLVAGVASPETMQVTPDQRPGGWLEAVRRVLAALSQAIAQPAVLTGVGGGFLLAALAVGVGPVWLGGGGKTGPMRTVIQPVSVTPDLPVAAHVEPAQLNASQAATQTTAPPEPPVPEPPVPQQDTPVGKPQDLPFPPEQPRAQGAGAEAPAPDQQIPVGQTQDSRSPPEQPRPQGAGAEPPVPEQPKPAGQSQKTPSDLERHQPPEGMKMNASGSERQKSSRPAKHIKDTAIPGHRPAPAPTMRTDRSRQTQKPVSVQEHDRTGGPRSTAPWRNYQPVIA